MSELKNCSQLAESHDLTIVQREEDTGGWPQAHSHVGMVEAAQGVSSRLCPVLLMLKTYVLVL